MKPRNPSRRQMLQWSALLGAATVTGCTPRASESGAVEKVWGRRGMSDGRLLKPRAIAIDNQDRLFIVDTTARIQVFDREGEFLRSFQTPAAVQGKPCGLGINQEGNLLVADTHYYRMLVYTPEGELLPRQTIGGKNGTGHGEFGFVTDAVQDASGCYYISEYGEFDRIQKFDPEGRFIFQWGRHGGEPGEFRRPQAMALDAEGQLWVCDAGNHRVQIFDLSNDQAEVVKEFGSEGRARGEFRFPYGLSLDPRGHVYVCEFGNHRVQKLTLDGKPLDAIGLAGRQDGEFHQPWSLAQDSENVLHVLDSYNHRVQRVVL